MRDFDVVVVGGGLAGLCAASFAFRAGARVALYESSPALGGHARTRIKEGYYFQLGSPRLVLRRGIGPCAPRPGTVPERQGARPGGRPILFAIEHCTSPRSLRPG